TAGGEVLMGTLRWEKEAEVSARQDQMRADFDRQRRELEFAEANTSAQIKVLQLDLERQRAALALNTGNDNIHTASSTLREFELRKRRSADPSKVTAGKRESEASK
ncbi:MAG: hypothetical protein Q8O50_03985, partial [Hydrogenophaga sp.]|nr:hypothetical protein [Hydrogenophaga sp.]